MKHVHTLTFHSANLYDILEINLMKRVHIFTNLYDILVINLTKPVHTLNISLYLFLWHTGDKPSKTCSYS